MALWGNNDNINSTGLVWLNYTTGVVTATGSSFGSTGGGGGACGPGANPVGYSGGSGICVIRYKI